MGQSSREDMEIQPLPDHTEGHVKIAGYSLLIDKERAGPVARSKHKQMPAIPRAQYSRGKNIALLDGHEKDNGPFWPRRLLF